MTSIKDQLTINLREEGVDHINISAYAESDLGKYLSPDWRRKFYIPHVGDFGSARAFANWMISGGDETLRLSAKFYKTEAPVSDFRTLVVFAKYYQLYSMRDDICANAEMFDKPWLMYKTHLSGVREMDRWYSFAAIVRELTLEVVKYNATPKFDWVNKKPGILECVNYYLSKIAGEGFIPFEKLDQVSKERNAERNRAVEEKRKTRETAEEVATPQEEVKSPLVAISEPCVSKDDSHVCPVAVENC